MMQKFERWTHEELALLNWMWAGVQEDSKTDERHPRVLLSERLSNQIHVSAAFRELFNGTPPMGKVELETIRGRIRNLDANELEILLAIAIANNGV